jgi:CRISPR/Cas system-associated exonuclease Cas4 (RecB family)
MSLHDDSRGNLPSASGMERLAFCPSSFWFEQAFPDTQTKIAGEGEFMHDVTMGFKKLSEATKDQARDVKRAWWMRDQLIKMTIGEAIRPRRENRIWIHDKIRLVASARYDEVWIGDDSYLNIDYKFGYKDVTPAHDNYQLMTQAVAMYQKYGYKRIYNAIVPPRCGDPTVVLFEEEDLKRSTKTIIDISDRAVSCKHLNWLKAGNHCNYCKARHVCPAAWELVA